MQSFDEVLKICPGQVVRGACRLFSETPDMPRTAPANVRGVRGLSTLVIVFHLCYFILYNIWQSPDSLMRADLFIMNDSIVNWYCFHRSDKWLTVLGSFTVVKISVYNKLKLNRKEYSEQKNLSFKVKDNFPLIDF